MVEVEREEREEKLDVEEGGGGYRGRRGREDKGKWEHEKIYFLDVFWDVEYLRSKVQDQEHLLKEKEGLVVSQIQPYRPIEKDIIDLIVKNLDKGKKKVLGIQINEPQMPINKFVMSKLDLQFKKEKKEKENLAKELEKVENEAQAIETMRKIHFIKSTCSLESWLNQST